MVHGIRRIRPLDDGFAGFADSLMREKAPYGSLDNRGSFVYNVSTTLQGERT